MGAIEKSTKEGIDLGSLPLLLTVHQGAEIAGIHPRTLSRKCQSGEVQAVKVGMYWKINTKHFLEWLGLSVDDQKSEVTEPETQYKTPGTLQHDDDVYHKIAGLEPVPKWVCDEAVALLALLRNVDEETQPHSVNENLSFIHLYEGLRILACAPVRGGR